MGVDLREAKVAVTGGAGFLGHWVLDALKRHGNVDPFVVRSAEYDLREKEAIQQLYSDVKPDVVIHLAAVVGGIGANRDNPGRFFYENMVMGLELIEQARVFNLSKFVMIGTVCAYPKFTPVPFKESDLWNGYPEETNAPYGVAKKALLVQCQAYRQQYGFNGIYLLPVNLYGPHDNFDLHSSHVIPALIRKCVHARDNDLPSIEVWGDGSPSREFIHARDAAEGIVLATRDFDGDEPVNLGSGHEITIRDLVLTIKELVGYEGDVVWATDKPNGQPRRCLATDRAKDLFAFEAKTTLKQGLAETIEWWESVKP